MEARYGTSYNAYLITGEKNVLVETVEANFFDEYLDNIQSVVDISKIDYLIMNHTEPDHSGSVAKLLEKNPNITVVCTTAAQKYLRAIANHDFPCIVAKHGDKLDIGGQELEFIVAPLLHWPDSMFTWMPQQKVLFTCDFLGAHFCEPTMLDSNIHYPEQYLGEVNYYYACIFGPFKPYVLAGLDKIKDLPVEMVCPSHGPCLVEASPASRASTASGARPLRRLERRLLEFSTLRHTAAPPSWHRLLMMNSKRTPIWMSA